MKQKISNFTDEHIQTLLDKNSASAVARLINVHKNSLHRRILKSSLRINLNESKRCSIEGGKKGGYSVHKIYSFIGENNPNWKGGVSKNNYHYKKIQMARYPEKVKARQLVNQAIRSGKMARTPCIICGDIQSFAHHADYNKPLCVTFYCRKHHREVHNNRH